MPPTLEYAYSGQQELQRDRQLISKELPIDIFDALVALRSRSLAETGSIYNNAHDAAMWNVCGDPYLPVAPIRGEGRGYRDFSGLDATRKRLFSVVVRDGCLVDPASYVATMWDLHNGVSTDWRVEDIEAVPRSHSYDVKLILGQGALSLVVDNDTGIDRRIQFNYRTCTTSDAQLIEGDATPQFFNRVLLKKLFSVSKYMDAKYGASDLIYSVSDSPQQMRPALAIVGQ